MIHCDFQRNVRIIRMLHLVSHPSKEFIRIEVLRLLVVSPTAMEFIFPLHSGKATRLRLHDQTLNPKIPLTRSLTAPMKLGAGSDASSTLKGGGGG